MEKQPVDVATKTNLKNLRKRYPNGQVIVDEKRRIAALNTGREPFDENLLVNVVGAHVVELNPQNVSSKQCMPSLFVE